MTTYGITGANGHYGTIARKLLDEKGIAYTAFVRDPSSVDFEATKLDYDNVQGNEFEGIDRLLFIPDARTEGREKALTDVIGTAAKNGVDFLVYVSFMGADQNSPDPLAIDHGFAEKLLEESGLNYFSLRSAMYYENFLGSADGYIMGGSVPSSSEDGRYSQAARDDLAEAAVNVLIADSPRTGVAELNAQTLSTPEMVEIFNEVTGRDLKVDEMSHDEYAATLAGLGLPEAAAKVFAAVDAATKQGVLDFESSALEELLGRTPKSFEDAVREWAASR